MANYTLNYTGEKVDELLNKIDTAFGETTVMGDTLTWDGDMTGKVYVEMQFPIGDEGNMTTIQYVKVSDSIPTFEELQNGGSLGAVGQTIPFPPDEEAGTGEEVVDIGSAIMIGQNVLIAKEDNADLTEILGITLPKKGVYFVSIPTMGMSGESFTINGYTGFEMVEITPIDPKYLPKISVGITDFTKDDGMYVNETIPYTPLYDHFFKGGDVEFVFSYGDSGTKAKTSMRAISCAYMEDGTGFKAVTFAAVVAMTGVIERIQFTTP